ncbi:MAG: hypothetical protein IT318_25335 [Anaerolineales bacterium]|nr:hypothetical protein [Anaerolineales bacterium]
MQKTPRLLLVILTMLLAPALACNTVVRGLSGENARATADAVEEGLGDIETEAQETVEAAEATAEAGIDALNDNSNDSGDDNQNDNEDGASADDPFEGQGPEDVPVYTEAGDVELLFGDESTLTYFIADASFDEVVDYYREAMEAEGWELATNGDNVFGQIASLQYEKDDRIAIIAITVEPGGDRIMVSVVIQ